MGKNYAGILGQFTGKVGNVVGAVSRGVQTTRVYQPIVNNPKTEKQILQRKLLVDANAFIKNECKYGLQPLLKKKYYSTTAYAKIVQAGITLLGAAMFPSEKRMYAFEHANLVFSDLGYGFGEPLAKGYKIIGSDYTTGAPSTGQTNPGEKYIGLSLPVDFYSKQFTEGTTPEIYIHYMFVDDGGRLRLSVPSETPKLTVMQTEDFHTYIDSYRIIDNVVIAACGTKASIEETMSQYYVKYMDSDYIFDNPKVMFAVGSELMPIIEFLSDSLGNVFTARHLVLSKMGE